MWHILEVLRSQLLLRQLRRYQFLRDQAINNIDELPPSWFHILKERQKRFWRKILFENRYSWILTNVLDKKTFANYVLRTALGFICGAIIIFLLLASLVIQMNLSITMATCICIMLAPFLCFGLAFSSKIRCAVLLILPQISSKRGRQVLVAFAFILAINGPMANSIYNLQEMTQSLTCEQEQARIAMGRLANAIKQPVIIARKVINKAIEAIKMGVNRLKMSVGAIETIVSVIVSVIESASSWLSSVVNVCNRKFGKPSERCYNAFYRAAEDCKAHLGPLFSWLCSVTYVASIACVTMHVTDFLCKIFHLISDSVAASVKRSAARFKAHLKSALYVDVEFHHSFNLTIDTGNVTKQSIIQGVSEEFKQSINPVLKFYHITGTILALTWLLVFIKAGSYYHKYMTSDRFDNHFITQQLKEIDMTRARNHLECILPLRPNERAYFCRLTGFRWLAHEKRHLAQSILFLSMSTITMLVILCVDYGFYWLLNQLSSQSTFLTHVPPANAVKLEVDGEGLVADMFRNISGTLFDDATIADTPQDFDPASCVPNPLPPDMYIYERIIFTFALAWIFVFIEPFILRLRVNVMNFYHPTRAQKRAVWLCGYILRERGGATRTIKRILGQRISLGGQPTKPLSFASLLEKLKDRFAVVRLIFGGKSPSACISCASIEINLINCETIGCSALYCNICYTTQEDQCILCGQCMKQPSLIGIDFEQEPSSEEETMEKQRLDPERQNQKENLPSNENKSMFSNLFQRKTESNENKSIAKRDESDTLMTTTTTNYNFFSMFNNKETEEPTTSRTHQPQITPANEDDLNENPSWCRRAVNEIISVINPRNLLRPRYESVSQDEHTRSTKKQ